MSLDKLEDLYKTLYQRTQELSLSGINADAVLYDPAVPAVKPSKPNKALLLVMVVALAMAFFFMYVIVKAAMDNSIRTLGQVTNDWASSHWVRSAALRGRGPCTGSRFDHAKPLNADIIHSIRTQILLDNRPQQVLAISSAKQGEGRSLLASLLANSFSFDQKTLLLDLDFFNRDGLSAEFSTSTSAGVAELLRGEVTLDAARITLSDTLDFLPRGKANASSLLMLSSERFEPLIRDLRNRYQRIIVDVSAVSQSQDIELISRVVDGVVFVVQAGLRPWRRCARRWRKLTPTRKWSWERYSIWLRKKSADERESSLAQYHY